MPVAARRSFRSRSDHPRDHLGRIHRRATTDGTERASTGNRDPLGSADLPKGGSLAVLLGLSGGEAFRVGRCGTQWAAWAMGSICRWRFI